MACSFALVFDSVLFLLLLHVPEDQGAVVRHAYVIKPTPRTVTSVPVQDCRSDGLRAGRSEPSQRSLGRDTQSSRTTSRLALSDRRAMNRG
jgi:hypothetical protein